MPAELSIKMPSFGPLESMKTGSPGPAGWGPPDLTQCIEDAYRSFLSTSADTSRSRKASHSNSLLTLESDINQFSFSAGLGESELSHASQAPSPSSGRDGAQLGGYTACTSRRFAELGYLEPPMPLNEVERRRAVRR